MKQTLSNPNSPPSSSASRMSPYSVKSPVKQIPFISKLERLLEQGKHICWSECGQNIVVNGIRTLDFTQELGGIGLSNKPESFIRQLNTYGFRKMQEPLDTSLMNKLNYSTDQVSVYHNQYFTRHFKNINEIHAIGKRKPVNTDRDELYKALEKIQQLEEDNQKLATFIHSHYVINPNQNNAIQQLEATNLLLGLKHTRVSNLTTNQTNSVSIPISVPLNIVNIQANQLSGAARETPLPCLPVTSTIPVVTSTNDSVANRTSSTPLSQFQLNQLQQLLLKNGCDIKMNKTNNL